MVQISGAGFLDFPVSNSSHFPPLLFFFGFVFAQFCFWIDSNSWKWSCTLVSLFSWYVFVALSLILKCIRKAGRIVEGWGVLPNCWIVHFFSSLKNMLIQWGARIIQCRDDGGSSWNILFLWLMYDIILFMFDALNKSFKNYTWDGTHCNSRITRNH